MSSESGDELENSSLEFTPTWVVAVVCFVIVAISLAVHHTFSFVEKFLIKKKKISFCKALQKIKEELMLVGFISLLLAVSQNQLTKICVPPGVFHHMHPCTDRADRLLAEALSKTTFCSRMNKIPLLSVEVVHHIHIFVFLFGIVHVALTLLIFVFGRARIKHLEKSIANKTLTDYDKALNQNVRQRGFYGFMGILRSIFKQFYDPVTVSHYMTLRHGFCMSHQCYPYVGDRFHDYMNPVFDDYFEQVIGINWYLWPFVVIFLLVNIYGGHAYFWISFVPVILLLAMGTSLERTITKVANEISIICAPLEIEEDDMIPNIPPSDNHFWFHRPRFFLVLIHFILFLNAFGIASIFWISITYGFNSCMMGQLYFTVLRLIIGGYIVFVCGYSTLPLYALVAQMGTDFKWEILNEILHESITSRKVMCV